MATAKLCVYLFALGYIGAMTTTSCSSCLCYLSSGSARCSGKRITRIPTDLPKNITFLSLEDTLIKELRNLEYYTALTHIHVENNPRLERISREAFSQNHQLNVIRITDNQSLKRISKDAFRASLNLRFLYLDGNSLEDFPDLSYLKIVNTTLPYALSLDRNPLTRPSRLCKRAAMDPGVCSFESVSIQKTQMANLPGYAFGNTIIYTLNLANNPQLQNVDNDAFLAMKFPFLSQLILSNNPLLETLPSAGLSSLKKLQFMNCPRLKTLPPTATFVEIEQINLTYPHHCCAFRKPELQDKHTYEKILAKYECKNEQSTWSSSSSATQTFDGGGRSWSKRSLLQFGPFVNPLDSSILDHTDIDEPKFIGSTIDPNINHEIDFSMNCSLDIEAIRERLICVPEENAFTPCVDVFEHEHWLRSALWIVAVLALLGNTTVLTFTIISSIKSPTPMPVTKFLICNLAFADLVLGVYLMCMAIIDLRSLGQYFNFATLWQYEGGCDAAGFLAIFSVELSVYTLSIITVERWYAISHALHLTKRVQMKHAVGIMLVGWILSSILAMLPLSSSFLPVSFSSYRLTSICLPFKFETGFDKAYIYGLLGLNCAAFLLIFCCYVSIFHQVRGSNAAVKSDSYLAKRMALLVTTDFVCWGPVAVVAALSCGGVNIPEKFLVNTTSLYVAKVILVVFFPINACFNPFLYAIMTRQFRKDCILTLNSVGLCKRKAQQLRLAPEPPSESFSRNHLGLRHSLMSNTTQFTMAFNEVKDNLRHSLDAIRTHGPLFPGQAAEAKSKACTHPMYNMPPRKTNSLGDRRLYQQSPSHSYRMVSTSSASTIDSVESRRPSDTLRVPETLKEDDCLSYDDRWQDKVADHDSGTDLRQLSESEDSRPFDFPLQASDVESEAESGYRGIRPSHSDDEELLCNIPKYCLERRLSISERNICSHELFIQRNRTRSFHDGVIAPSKGIPRKHSGKEYYNHEPHTLKLPLVQEMETHV